MKKTDISEVDQNFCDYYSSAGIKMHDVNEPVFTLYGLYRNRGETDFKRLPEDVAMSTKNESVQHLYTNTSGIRVRFKTDSKQIVLKCILPSIGGGDNMSFTGSSCFDLYADGEYCTVFRPGIDINGKDTSSERLENGYASGYVFKEKKMRDIVINFPLYNDVEKVFIGLEEDAQLHPGNKYSHNLPVVFYGSSITQGGCASHPGNAYPNMISRKLDTDIINLGFSGGCRAESELANYISNLPMSIFVFDYDHNAPTLEHLEKTHYSFYRTIREKQPDLPIIMISAADHCFPNYLERREVIRSSYQKALSNGDENVYFIDGGKMYEGIGLDYCVVDTTHPNDLGFWCMANMIGEVISKLLGDSISE